MSEEVKEAPNPQEFAKEVVCMSVKFRKVGDSRKIPGEMLRYEAPDDQQPEKDLLRGSKVLLECDEMKAIKRFIGDIRDYLWRRSQAGVLRPGMYLVKPEVAVEIDERFNEERKTWNTLLGDLLAAYPLLLETEESRLGAAFNADDYPDEENLLKKFEFSWRAAILDFQVPTSLKSLSKAFFKREQEKAAQELRGVLENCGQLLRAEVLDVCEHVVERLTGFQEKTCKKCAGTGQTPVVTDCEACAGTGQVTYITPADEFEDDTEGNSPTETEGPCDLCKATGKTSSQTEECADCGGKGTVTVEGKPKTFRDTFLPNVLDTLSYLQDRDFTGDTELQTVAGHLKDCLAGANLDSLRSDGEVREKVRLGFEVAKAKLEEMMVDRPIRMFGGDI